MKQLHRPSFRIGSALFWLAMSISGCGQSAIDELAAQNRSSANGHIAVTISKATTYVTEPLNADGYPDYIAALNRIAGEGVRPEDNAAVILTDVVLATSVNAKDREALFGLLGTSPPLETDQHFVFYNDYVKEHAPGQDEVQEKEGNSVYPSFEQEQRAANGPWSEKDCPLVAQWLAANDKPLAAVIEASKRTRYYFPVISPTDKAVAAYSSQPLSNTRFVAEALRARAMLRLQEGKIEEAWNDLQACHRLSRLLGQGRTYIEPVVAMVIDEMASDGQCRLAHFSRLTPEQAESFRADLQKLPPLLRLETARLAERFLFLDAACSAAHGKWTQGLPRGDDAETQALRDGIAKWNESGVIDWNGVLYLGNEWFDRLAAATILPQAPERRKAVYQLDMDLEALRVATAKVLYSGTGQPPRPVASQQVASQIWHEIVGSPMVMFDQGERLIVHRQAAEVALVLSEYRTEHGQYPDTLGDLTEKCPAELLNDPYSGNELRYRRQGDGYTLYSVGPNGKDNGGVRPNEWTIGDDDSLLHSDDVGIRMGIDEKRGTRDAMETIKTDVAKTAERQYFGVGEAIPDFTIFMVKPAGNAVKFTKRDLTGKVAVVQVWKNPAELAKMEELIKVYEKTDKPIVFIAINMNISELVVQPALSKGGKAHLESKYPALIHAEANLLGRKNVCVAVDREKCLLGALGLDDGTVITDRLLLVVDGNGIIRVRVVDFGSKPDEWPLSKLKTVIGEE
jgi:hypothetical protein